MSFQFSCFISYRHHLEDKNFMLKFKKIIEAEAFKVTNQQNVFFDDKSIKWGEEFDHKIYEGIVSSYFFIPLFHHVYLHEDSLWCAKELHWAIQLENKIREKIAGYCFILPIIDRGSPSDFPDCIGKKNAKEIKKFRHLILGNKTTAAFEDFKGEIYEILLKNYELLEKETIFKQYLSDIKPIPDDEIKSWVKSQKDKQKSVTASHLPVLTKKIV